jgi:hypothetical protein
LLLAGASFSGARLAAGQVAVVSQERSYAPFASLHLDGGMARNFDRHRWGLLGGVAAGMGLYDGAHIWNFTAGVRGMRGDQRAVTISGARATVESGWGLSTAAIWDLDRKVPGIGAGVSLSLLTLEGDLVFDGTPTKYVSLFVSLPVGFLAYLVLGGRR